MLVDCAHGLHLSASFSLLPASGQVSESIGTIFLHLEKKTIDAAAKIRIEGARRDALRFGAIGTAERSNTAMSLLTRTIARGSRADLYRAIERFLSRLDPLKKVITSVSEVRL